MPDLQQLPAGREAAQSRGFLPVNSLSFQSERNMVEALFPEKFGRKTNYLILFHEALTLHEKMNQKAENW